MKRLLIVTIVLALVAGFGFAGAEAEDSGGDEQVTIRVNMEGYAGGEGTPEEIIAAAQNSLDSGELNANQAADTQWKIDYMRALDAAAQERGVEWEGVDWGWAEQLTQRQLNAFLAGQGPDILVGEVQMPGFARQGYLEPFPPALAAKVRAEVVPGAYGPMEVDGEIYGIATFPGVNVLFWNKDLLAQAGLDTDRAPATWGEWLDMVEQITEAGDGEFYGGGTYAGPNFGGSLRVGPFMMMAGGGFIDDNGDVAFDTPGNVRALSFMRELAKNSPPGAVAGASEGGWWDALNQGKIAYVVDGPWRLGAGNDLGMNIGYSTLPIPEGGQPANVTIGAAFYGVPTYAENKEEAFLFIEALIDESVQDLHVQRAQRPPVLKSYSNDPEFASSYIATFHETLYGDVSGLPTFKGDSNARIWDVFHQAMAEAVVTDGDIEEILARAQELGEQYQGD
jgi:multiple sugar transport system substrate-binding protein